MAERTHDPATYRKMQEPFGSPETANAALQAFFDDVKAARVKHHIADVLLVINVNVVYPSGEGQALTCSMIGDELRGEPMAAYAHGAMAAEHREMMNTLLSGKALRKPK